LVRKSKKTAGAPGFRKSFFTSKRNLDINLAVRNAQVTKRGYSLCELTRRRLEKNVLQHLEKPGAGKREKFDKRPSEEQSTLS